MADDRDNENLNEAESMNEFIESMQSSISGLTDFSHTLSTLTDELKELIESTKFASETANIFSRFKAPVISALAEERQSILGTVATRVLEYKSRQSAIDELNKEITETVQQPEIQQQIIAASTPEEQSKIQEALGTLSSATEDMRELVKEFIQLGGVSELKRLEVDLQKMEGLPHERAEARDEWRNRIPGIRGSASNEQIKEHLQEEIDKRRQLLVGFADHRSAIKAAREALFDQTKASSGATKVMEKQFSFLNRLQFSQMYHVIRDLLTEIQKLISVVRQTQQEFGLTAGEVARLRLLNLWESIQSGFRAVVTGGAETPVSREEVMGMQGAFRAEFGGMIAPEDAEDLAGQAKAMGVTAQAFAEARRQFLTISMGDAGQAISSQERLIKTFNAAGLTSKDAMEAISRDANVMARSGARFQQAFARAAIDAKKIGVDLSRVDQVGDNIIGNFEGFLESTAELGAMGFGFDPMQLAMMAETMDPEALMNELRSQLASQGKDITKLRRSEQLALSQAFGLSMADFQRLASPTPEGGGEDLDDPNKILVGALTQLTNFLEPLTGAIKGLTAAVIALTLRFGARKIAQVLAGRAGATAVGQAAGTMGASVAAGGAGGVVSRMGAGIIGSMGGSSLNPFTLGGHGFSLKGVGSMGGRLLKRGGYGLGLGAGGAMLSGAGEALTESGHENLGAVAGIGGSAASGAAMGAMFGPWGMAIGALIGGIKGVVENFDVLKNMAGVVADTFVSIIGKITRPFGSLKDWFKERFSGGDEEIRTSDNWLPRDQNSLNTGASGIQYINGQIVPAQQNQIFRQGNDIFSQANPSGYGERTLLTPTAVVALNNDDNVIAYADDMVSRQADIDFYSKGALAPDKQAPQEVQATVDLSRLEQKMDQFISALKSMEVSMDGNRVGEVLVTSERRASQVGIFHGQRVG